MSEDNSNVDINNNSINSLNNSINSLHLFHPDLNGSMHEIREEEAEGESGNSVGVQEEEEEGTRESDFHTAAEEGAPSQQRAASRSRGCDDDAMERPLGFFVNNNIEEEEELNAEIGERSSSSLSNSSSALAAASVNYVAGRRSIEETNVSLPPMSFQSSFRSPSGRFSESLSEAIAEGIMEDESERSERSSSSATATATATDRQPTTSSSSGSQPSFYHQSVLRQQQQSQSSQSSLSSQQRSSTSFPSVYSIGGAASNHHHHQQQAENSQPEQAIVEEEGASFSSAYNGNSSGWSVVDTAQGVPPSARSLHAASLLNGILYVFGGYDGNQRVNTFHAFSFADKRWSPVLPSANSSGPPSPRDRHVAVAFGNSFYVHGGFDGTSRVSDFWAFDFSSMTWREVLPVEGRPPSPRHSHAAVVHGQSLYVFGGYDGSYKSDLHEYDFTTFRWNQVVSSGRRPRPRYRATCVVHKNSMILYGGHDGTRHLSDSFMFDFDTRAWTTLLTEGIQPIPRDSHVSVVHGNSMYVFGGSSGSAMNDLHELQLPSTTSNSPSATSHINNINHNNNNNIHGAVGGSSATTAKWRPVKISGAGQPRHRFCHTAVAYNESMFIFGGYDGSERLNDFIKFDFAVHDLSFEVPPSTIISDFGELINDETLSDVTFIVDNRPVYAHKLMLMRCSYFRALFLGEMKESKLSSIKIEQVSYPIFLAILEYLYTDQVLIPFDSAMNLFEAADLFCIPRLKTMCEKCMLQSINVENAATIFHGADMHSATALRQKAKKYILYHFEEISKTATFEEMGRSNIELVFELLHSR